MRLASLYQSLLGEFVLIKTIWVITSVTNVTNANCWKETNQCATDVVNFKRRAESFNCTKGSYMCILTTKDLLVETCASIYYLSSTVDGCPTVFCGSHGVGLSPSSQAYCPPYVDGCPNGNKRFSTSTLYLYPKCLLRLKDRFSINTHMATIIQYVNRTCSSNDPQSQGNTVLLTLLVIACVLIAVGWVLYRFRRHRRHRRHINLNWDNPIHLENGVFRYKTEEYS